MARKNVIVPFKVIDAGDMSGDITSEVTDLQNQDNCCYQVAWSGTTPVGEIFIQVTTDDIRIVSSPVWVDLDFGSAITVSGNTGNHLININQFPGKYIRAFYDRTSGTGSLDVTITSKQTGG